MLFNAKREKSKPRKKLVLINPIDHSVQYYGSTLEPLNLAYVAAYTPNDWAIELIDENYEECDYRPADLVAITVVTRDASRAYQIAAEYRKRGIPVIGGGMHIGFFPEEAAQYFTSIVTGEAENIWEQVVRDFECGKLQMRYDSQNFNNLQNLKLPRRDIYQRFRYFPASVMTTKGCPFNCNYCCVTALNGVTYRMRPVESVIAELKSITCPLVFFVDDNLIGSTPKQLARAKELFRQMIKHKVRKLWTSQVSMNIAEDDELMELAKESGCVFVFIGIEAINPLFLKAQNKITNLRIGPENYKQVFDRLHQHGIGVNGTMMIGHYDETEDDYKKIYEFLLGSGIDKCQFAMLSPFPGTRFYTKCLEKDMVLRKNYPEDWKYYNGETFILKTKNHTPEDLFKKYTKLCNFNFSWYFILYRFLRSWWATKRFLVPFTIFNMDIKTKIRHHNIKSSYQRFFKPHKE